MTAKNPKGYSSFSLWLITPADEEDMDKLSKTVDFEKVWKGYKELRHLIAKDGYNKPCL